MQLPIQKRGYTSPSDHIFGGKKESLISMFEGSLEIIKPYKKNQRVKMTELGIKEKLCL